jgi:hypothetical protein
MNNLSFRSPFIVNTEPIGPILNGIFANKYGKIWCWLRNNEKLLKVWSQFFKYLFTFGHIWKYSVYRYSDSTGSISDE